MMVATLTVDGDKFYRVWGQSLTVFFDARNVLDQKSITNLSINPIQPGFAPHTMNWVTSQTAPFRRVNLDGNLDLMDRPPSGPAFGSHFMNTRISSRITFSG